MPGISNLKDRETKQVVIFILPFCLILFHFNIYSQVNSSWISTGVPGETSSSATTLEIDQQGNVIVAGSADFSNNPGKNIFVAKYGEDGELVWFQNYESQDTILYAPNTLCVDNEGNVYIIFMRNYLNTNISYWAIAVQKYNGTDGTFVWNREIGDAQFSFVEWQVKPEFMTIDDNYLYFACTKFEPGVTGSSMIVVKMDFNGDTLWTATHKGSGMYSKSKSVAVDISGNVYVAGDAGNETIDYCVVKFNQNGDLVWYAYYDGQVYNNTDIAQDLKVDNLGNVYLTGYSQVSSNECDIVTVKYNPDGIFQWASSYGTPEYHTNRGYFIDTGASGNLYVGGYSAYNDPYPGTGKDYLLLKYDQSGNLLWEARWDYLNYGNDHPFDFEMGPAGNIYVCGVSVKSCYTGEFITVLKYNQQGELQWNVSVPGIYGIPWEISVIDNDRFVVAGDYVDSLLIKHAAVLKFDDTNPVVYENNITGFYFESQTAPPVIDYENHTVTATVSDTANLNCLVPYITVSDYACLYPGDGDTVSFLQPAWYKVTSFDNVEQWWVVYVEGGYVGKTEFKKVDVEIFPNPAQNEFCVTGFETSHQAGTFEMFDITGQKVMVKVIPAGQDKIFLKAGNLKRGIYLCRINLNGKSIIEKIIFR